MEYLGVAYLSTKSSTTDYITYQIIGLPKTVFSFQLSKSIRVHLHFDFASYNLGSTFFVTRQKDYEYYQTRM